MKSRAANASARPGSGGCAAPAARRRRRRRSPHVVPGRLPAHLTARTAQPMASSSPLHGSRPRGTASSRATSVHPRLDAGKVDCTHADRVPWRQPHRRVARRRLLPAARPADDAARAAEQGPRRRHGGGPPLAHALPGARAGRLRLHLGRRQRRGDGRLGFVRGRLRLELAGAPDAPGRRLRGAARVDRGAGAADRGGAPDRPRVRRIALGGAGGRGRRGRRADRGRTQLLSRGRPPPGVRGRRRRGRRPLHHRRRALHGGRRRGGGRRLRRRHRRARVRGRTPGATDAAPAPGDDT